ncbi:NYN domain-containing protein [Rhodobacter sp. KR11]|uniref:NYN domain-containing protein n=1 Tax=Rhodobacter sp. KR11 TaxID=2974588 RepID=UPI00222330D9|nr:NYN domain-containing protein [Rhodobacter sp. KR11]MCW1919145.1 NYN domain-containing protein [Rhodobacter sp. KR11]
MTNPVALLIDADNVPAARYPEILAQAKARGEVVIRRAFLDATRCAEWSQVPGLRLAHAGSAKNAADLLMTVEAMELALHGKVEHFVLASSDGDFSHLALRLREYGLEVHGIGETRAPARFREACTGFHELAAVKPVVAQVPPKMEKPAKPPAPIVEPTKAPPPPRNCSQVDLEREVCQLIAEKGGRLPLNQIQAEILRRTGVTISTRPEKNWRAYLTAHPKLFALDPKGPEACVRRLS